MLFDGVDPGDEVEPGVIDTDVQRDEVRFPDGLLIGGTPAVQDFFVVPAEGHVPGLRLEDPVALVAAVQKEPEFVGPEVRDTHLVQLFGTDRFGNKVRVSTLDAVAVLRMSRLIECHQQFIFGQIEAEALTVNIAENSHSSSSSQSYSSGWFISSNVAQPTRSVPSTVRRTALSIWTGSLGSVLHSHHSEPSYS